MTEQSYTQVSDPKAFGRVAVLMGGRSAEREVSLMSGAAVLDALQTRGVDAHGIDVDSTVIEKLVQGNFDRVFNALHGRGGEDGTIQGLLEMLELPYTGSGVAASALTMDKLRTKQLLHGAALPTPDWWVLNSEQDCVALASELSYPVITKPALEGSSIGMTRVNSSADLLPAWQIAAANGDEVIAERWVMGSEYTAAILQNTVLPLIRIETDNNFYDYEAKYFSDDTQYVCPAGLSSTQENDFWPTGISGMAMCRCARVGAS